MTERQIADQSGDMLQPDRADDIVQRLCSTRTYNCYSCTEYGYDSECACSMVADLLTDAADEIERLRDELAAWRGTVRAHEALAAKAADEIERLQVLTNKQVADDPDDIVQELKDWQYIIGEVQGKAVVMMLSGAVFGEAADDIERLESEVKRLRAEVDVTSRLLDRFSNALDDIIHLTQDRQVLDCIKEARRER
jgi:hypothetical protein